MGENKHKAGMDKRQAWLGPAYVRALAAQAGYVWDQVEDQNDVFSFDGHLGLWPGTPTSVQVKCFRGAFINSKSYEIQPAWRRNWTDLVMPAYFVVVEVPNDCAQWAEHRPIDRTTLLRTSAYWTRIDPLPPEKKRVQVKSENRLTVETFDEWYEEMLPYIEALRKVAA